MVSARELGNQECSLATARDRVANWHHDVSLHSVGQQPRSVSQKRSRLPRSTLPSSAVSGTKSSLNSGLRKCENVLPRAARGQRPDAPWKRPLIVKSNPSFKALLNPVVKKCLYFA